MRRLPLLLVLGLSVLTACSTVEPEAPDEPEMFGETSRAQSSLVQQDYHFELRWDGAAKCPTCQYPSYACSDNTGNWNGGARSFTDPVKTGWIVISADVELFGRGYDGGLTTVLLNSQELGAFSMPPNPYRVCGGCYTPEVGFKAPDSTGMPGYRYGNTNTLTLRSERTNCFAAARIRLRTGRPLLKVNPSSLSFGSIAVGTSASQKVRLSNEGAVPLIIDAMSLPLPFKLTPVSLPFTLKEGAFLDVTVTYAPTADRVDSGILSLLSSDPDKGSLPIKLEGTGGAPKLELAPAALDFGAVRVGTSSSLLLQVKNVGSLPLTIPAVLTQAPFTVSGLPPGGSVVQPGTVLPLTVTFTATAGVSSLPMYIQAQGSATPLAEVSLHGTGIEPAIVVAATSLDFGVHTAGVDPVRKTLAVSNSGLDDLILTAFDVEAPFTVESGLPLTIQAREQASLTVTYAPGAGRAAKDLILRSNDPRTPAVKVALTGTGVEVPALKVTASDGGTALEFGSREVSSVSAPQTLTLKNEGAGTLVVEPIQPPTGFAVTPAGRFSLAPGATTQVQVTFEPPHIAQFAQELMLSADGPGGSSQTVLLSGQGVEGKLTATPSALSFARTEVGNNSKAVQVTIVNSGTDTLTLSTIAVAGPFSVVLPELPKELTPRDAFTMEVTFIPVEDGAATGVLRVFSNAPSSPTVVKLDGEGLQAVGRMASDVMEFGGQRLGGLSPPRELTLFNMGSESLNVTAVNVSGPFQVSGLNVGTSVPPLGNRTFQVSYKPTETTAENGVLEVQSNAPRAAQVTLRGTGTTASMETSVTALTFGSQFLGEASQRVVELRNTGTSPVTITGLDPVDGFSLSGLPLPHVVGPGTSHPFYVVFEPPRPGDYAGSLAVRHDASSTPLTITVQGSGVAQGLTVTPGAIVFGNQRVDATSQPLSLELVNTGNVPVTVEVKSSDAAFRVDTSAVSGAIAAGGRASIPVTFHPTRTGTVRGEVRVVPSGGGLGPTVVPVEGIGEAVTVEGSGCAVGGSGGVWVLAAWMLARRRARRGQQAR
ncbi:choice-of-anchor D domain-containing protein [Corallococcus sp. AB030]|uniref:choice-of-anchor D domain-containing protein n=4 Tax=Myxococcaceae TaxID=31 RepID=UPI000EE778CB|nr:choice-of-anchor D domain-containing protein [Corallococcus sp. AB018]RKH96831.1 choice-of-anchor D domain-containing protein [Corallococcus sp. AB030]RUO92787.1 choice-of-anchor D domain-containing protein [Corallococcus sp. AB018]